MVDVAIPKHLEGLELADAALRFMDLPVVYVAGPYASPDPVLNTNTTIRVADALNATDLVVCHIPHLTMLHHLVTPHEVDYWYALDYAFLAKCDALLRLPGKSSGADLEELLALQLELPVFHDDTKLLEWAAEW